MPFADRKTWEKIRPGDIKDTGIGDACDLWKKNCKDPADVAATKEKTSAALIGIDKMFKALTNATGKLSKVKDAKKKTAVQNLLTEWKKETEDYQKALEAAVHAANDEEVEAKLEVGRQHFLSIFAETEEKIAALPAKLDEIDRLIEQRNGTKAENNLNAIRTDIKRQFWPNVFKPTNLIQMAEREKNLKPGSLKPSDFAHKFNPLKQTLKNVAKRVEELTDQALELGEVEEPRSSENDPEYQRKYNDILKAYKDIVAKLQPYPGQMNRVITTCVTMKGNKVLQADDAKMVDAIATLIKEIDKVEQEAADVLEPIRGKDGAVIKRRTQANFTEQDILSFSGLQTRAITVNGRVVAGAEKAREHLREELDRILQAGNQQLAGRIQELQGKLAR